MALEFKEILYEKKDQVARITINREAAMNALSVDVFTELAEAFHDFGYDPSVGVAVLTGAGNAAFAAGADIKRIKDEATTDTLGGLKLCGEFNRTALEMRSCGKPIIARVNGLVIGGGFELLLFCDLAIAVDAATFTAGEAFVGAVPIGATQLTPMVVGDKRARWLLLTDARLDAKTALDWGVVNKVVPYNKLDEEVDNLCKLLLNKFPWALRFTKTQLNFWHDIAAHTFTSGRDFWGVHVGTTNEMREGITAFLDKRSPKYAEIRASAAAGKPPEYHWGPPTKSCLKCKVVDLPAEFEYCGKCGSKLA
jgi:enoyl-CoA hydratase/carnithine racemase